MKRSLLVAMALYMFASLAWAQDDLPAPTQDPNVPYRLFNTKNIYTFLKLDTRDGKIWQVQWGDENHRFTEALNSRALATGGKAGRFTMYPTSNIFTFILLDQVTGEAWHVQWGTPDKRFIVGID